VRHLREYLAFEHRFSGSSAVAYVEPERRPLPDVSPDFRSNFQAHAPFVYRILRRLGVPRADRDDLLQEVFFIVHRKLHEYDGRASFRAWLYGICVRTVSTYRRSARVRRQESREYSDVEERESEAALDPELTAESRRACAELEALLGRLDDEKRTVFVLYELEELPMVEVAQAVGCPLQTAYSRLHAARKAMRMLITRNRLGESGIRRRPAGI
jgi:RNA polymerase sigma-70 factor (ECF subfamily)